MKKLMLAVFALLVPFAAVAQNATVGVPAILNGNPVTILTPYKPNGDGTYSQQVATTGSGSNPAAGSTGAAVPSSGSYTAFNVAGNLVGVSASNPLPVTGASGGPVTQSTGGGTANTWTVGGVISNPTATFTTTGSTAAWASNQLIANSATAGSVVPLTFTNACRVVGGSGSIRRAQIQVASDTGFAGQSLVLALYTSAPTFANGDRATWLTNYSGFIGTIAVTLSQHFSDYEQGVGTPVNGSDINFTCSGGSTTIYGAVISAGTLTPPSGVQSDYRRA